MSNRQGVEAPRPLALAQKDNRKVKSNSRRHQETERNTGGRCGCTRDRGHKNTTSTTQDRQGAGLRAKAGRGGSIRAGDGVRQREVGTLQKVEPLGLTWIWAQAKDGEWGGNIHGKAVTGSQKELLGTPGMRGERRRAVEVRRQERR